MGLPAQHAWILADVALLPAFTKWASVWIRLQSKPGVRQKRSIRIPVALKSTGCQPPTRERVFLSAISTLQSFSTLLITNPAYAGQVVT